MPIDPKGAKPDAGKMAPDGGKAAEIILAASDAGSLSPIQDILDEKNLPFSAEDLMAVAPDIESLKGKSPQEIADVLKSEDGDQALEDVRTAIDNREEKAEAEAPPEKKKGGKFGKMDLNSAMDEMGKDARSGGETY